MSQAADGIPETWTTPPPCDTSARGCVTVSEWCRSFDVIDALVPFGTRTYDPIQYLIDVRELVEDAPLTKATFNVKELTTGLGYRNVREGNYMRPLLRTAGLWEYCETSRFPDDLPTARWVNPEYIHASSLPAITDERERITELRRAASLGIFHQRDLVDRFGGESRGTVMNFCNSRGIPWGDWRKWGLGRIARTIKIAHEWTAHSFSDLARAIGMGKKSTVHEWARHTYAGDFEVPPDPADEPWFNPTRKVYYERQ